MRDAPRLSPRSEALAFRIWAHCSPQGWGLAYQDVADALGVPRDSVIQVVRLRGWAGRFRSTTPARFGYVPGEGVFHRDIALALSATISG